VRLISLPVATGGRKAAAGASFFSQLPSKVSSRLTFWPEATSGSVAILVGVQIGSVPRKLLQLQPILCRSGREEVFDRLATMDRRAIPDRQHLDPGICPALVPGQVVVDGQPHRAQRRERLGSLSRRRDVRCFTRHPTYRTSQSHRRSLLKIKGLPCRIGARTKEALVETISEALDAGTPEDARSFALPSFVNFC
jgi:hypothetical protein